MSIIKNGYKELSCVLLFFFLIFKVDISSFPLFKIINPVIYNTKSYSDDVLESVDSFFDEYLVFRNNKKEINRLREKNRILLLQNSILSVYKAEVENLKNMLNLRKEYLSFSIVPVLNVESENKDFLSAKNISNELIKEGEGVISNQGVVGMVYKTVNDSIKIVPFFSKDSSIPVWVGNNRIFAFATGNGDSKSLTLRLKYVEKSTIKVNDKIVTNGYDSIFPENILVGEVKSIKNVKNDLFVEVEVLSYSKLNSRYFYVLKK